MREAMTVLRWHLWVHGFDKPWRECPAERCADGWRKYASWLRARYPWACRTDPARPRTGPGEGRE